MRTFVGNCHCGAVRFELESDLVEFTRCDCSLCQMKNAVMLQVHESNFSLLSGEPQLALYQWNMHIARHHFCQICGIYTFHRKRSAPDYYGINAFCLQDVDISRVPIRQVHGSEMSVTAP